MTRLGGPEKAAHVLLSLPRPQAMELIKQLEAEDIKVLT
jgi:flagellar motor switch protein FliG